MKYAEALEAINPMKALKVLGIEGAEQGTYIHLNARVKPLSELTDQRKTFGSALMDNVRSAVILSRWRWNCKA